MNQRTKQKIAKQYYEEGSSPLTDAEWDAMYEDDETVGYESGGEVKHIFKMLSLQKTFSLVDLEVWEKQFDSTCVRSPKLDGSAISLQYENGELVRAATRGNGVVGVDVTEKSLLLVPKEICIAGTVQIDGEVVVPKSIPNARNYAAGSLNLKDIREFEERADNGLKFVAYDLRSTKATVQVTSWTQLMGALSGEGFITIMDSGLEDIYPTDGEVYRVNNLVEWREQGSTAHHPRGSIAYKIQEKGVETTLLDVVWQVGKSGVVSPVAMLDPVVIDGAVISRATLHNIQYINDLNLEIGCRVEVIRSGKIIPRIVRRLDEK
jgi:DNA ligase (NAD+)